MEIEIRVPVSPPFSSPSSNNHYFSKKMEVEDNTAYLPSIGDAFIYYSPEATEGTQPLFERPVTKVTVVVNNPSSKKPQQPSIILELGVYRENSELKTRLGKDGWIQISSSK